MNSDNKKKRILEAVGQSSDEKYTTRDFFLKQDISFGKLLSSQDNKKKQ